MNFLLASKVRQHGMSDRRWTTSEKLGQFKVLVKLIKRDHRQRKGAGSEYGKKIHDELHKFTRAVKSKREKLRSILSSDRRLVECVLIQNKPLRLACRQLKADEIIEAVKQTNYSLRRRLDLILHRSGNKEKYLTQLLLEVEELKMSIFCTTEKRLPFEKECLRITGKVQHINLLKEAAISVYNTYGLIINTLKKDRIYYDHVLDTLKDDLINQNRCILKLILIGQISFESMDDMKTECSRIHGRVDLLNSFKADLRRCMLKIECIKKTMNTLIRKDNDFQYYLEDKEHDKEFQKLCKDIEAAESLLTNLQKNLFLSKYDQIATTLVGQKELNTKLEDLIKRRKQDKQNMLDTVNNFEKKYESLMCTTSDTDFNYRAGKAINEQTIAEQVQEQDAILKKKQKRNYLLRDVMNRLQCIERSLKIVSNDKEKSPKDEKIILSIQQILKQYVDQKEDQIRDKFEEANMLELFMEMTKKTYRVLEDEPVVESRNSEEQDGFEQEDSSVLTRQDIKLASIHVVEMATASII